MRKGWSDLPHELLSQIASGLGLIEFLSFRGVCKDWYVASSKLSPEPEDKSFRSDPWFLIYEGEGSEFSLLTDQDHKPYTISIPELVGATCLASKEGWLLVFCCGSLFFFCPFSRAKIELPDCPFNEVTEHVAAFSSAPTSEDCIVAVANRSKECELHLYTICRGQKEWAMYDYSRRSKFNIIRSALFYQGEIHFLDGGDGLVTFNSESKTKESRWKTYSIGPTSDVPASDLLYYELRDNPFQSKYRSKVRDASLSTCGTIIPHDGGEHDIFPNESIEAEEPSTSRHLKGVWIQPRYIYVPPGQRW
ncbi:F-box/kelch-repeat protein At1g57790 [Cajanus cajan]|uniref:F-box protein At4g00893 family n=1 Tax=Cajanus cajan TaxID=3821 RepID=A0A151RL68_CAJCA|nr:F-box/kelch-repeat protein At1g57790 [Cajanus cajan]KYP43301.1 F-box protein At4g00893 family [Cajanus cajan]